jgi:hypothetical protein
VGYIERARRELEREKGKQLAMGRKEEESQENY